MADIPALVVGDLGETVDPDKIYDNSLYKPTVAATANDTFEALNGLMDSTNYTGSKNIQASHIQPGTFATGEYDGSDEWVIHSAQQTGRSADDASFIDHSLLAKRFFVPYDKAVVLYGYQAWFTHTAVQWKISATNFYNEEWFVRLYVDGVVKQAQVANLPIMTSPMLKGANGYHDPAALPRAVNFNSFDEGPGDGAQGEPGVGRADRWRYVAKSGLLSVTGKGYHTIQVKLWPDGLAPDAEKLRCITRSGGIFVLIMRAGNDLITGS